MFNTLNTIAILIKQDADKADGGNQKNWLEASCVGKISNKSAIGAKLRLKATLNGKPVWLRRDVAGQEGYCGQNLRLHFGLGDAAVVDSLIVSWPSSKTEVLTQVAARQLLTLVEGDNSTNVKDQKGATPQGFRLNQNYPNPFNPATQIEYALPSAERVILRVYDLAGTEIQTSVEGYVPAGQYAVTWDGTNHLGRRVGSGVYFCQIRAGEFQKTHKMLLVHSSCFVQCTMLIAQPEYVPIIRGRFI